jgi:MFS family permease
VVQNNAVTTTFKGAWRHRRWRWLLASFAVSSIGDYLYFVALAVFLIEATGSPSWLAAAAIARLLAYALLGPLGGAIADRYDRRRLVVLLDVVRAGLMVLLAVVAWSDGSPALAIALTVLNAAASTPFRPAVVAATPLLVDEDDLAAANAAESIVGQLAFFVGPGLGATVVVLGGTGTAFLVNGVTFAVSAVLLVRTGPIGGRAARTSERHEDDEHESVRQQIVDGFATIRADRGLIALVAFTSAVVFLYGFEQVVHVLVATERLGMSASGVGVLGAAVGVGGLIVAPFTARLGGGPSAGMLLAVSGLLLGVPMALLAVITNPVVAIAVLLVEGMGMIVFEVMFITLLQRATPEDALARVFGLQDSVTAVAQLLGSLAAPILVAVVALEGSLWIAGGTMVVASVLLAGPLNAMSTRADAERQRYAPVTERLRRLGIFGDASQAALERLARSAVERWVSAGTAVFHEGDQPDDLFIIVSGEAAVTRAGVGEVSRLTTDEWFGEIGLVRGAPRNATVSAVGDLEVLAIPGAVFLDALTLNEVLPDPLRLTLTARMASTTGDSTTMTE